MATHHRLQMAVSLMLLLASSAHAQVQRIWLTHRTHDPSKMVVNWTTEERGSSVVRYGLTKQYDQEVKVKGSRTLHHVEIPIPERDTTYDYSVSTGVQASTDATFKAYPTDILRVAVVADWQGKPDLPGLIKDNVHLLLTAGDNISSTHQLCGPGVKDRRNIIKLDGTIRDASQSGSAKIFISE